MVLFNLPQWLWAVLLIIGILGLVTRNKIADMVGGVGSIVGLKTKQTLMIFAVLGIVFGGVGIITGWVGGIGTASGLTGDDIVSVEKGALDCKFTTAPTEVNVTTGSIIFRADTGDDSNYFADIPYTQGDDRVQGYLLCSNDRDNVRQGVSYNCQAEADSYRSETDTTDSSTYYIVSTNTVVSAVSGYPWQQDIFLGDEGNTASASGSSDGNEEASLLYAQDEDEQYLGFNFSMPSNTNWAKLNNQTSKMVNFFCDGAKVGSVTLTKTTA